MNRSVNSCSSWRILVKIYILYCHSKWRRSWMKEWRAPRHFLDQRTVKESSSETLLRLDELVFTLNCNHHKQTNGAAIGTKMGPSYGNLFVGFIEHQFSQYHCAKPELYGRYIDDCIGATSSTREELTQFMPSSIPFTRLLNIPIYFRHFFGFSGHQSFNWRQRFMH